MKHEEKLRRLDTSIKKLNKATEQLEQLGGVEDDGEVTAIDLPAASPPEEKRSLRKWLRARSKLNSMQ